MAANSRFAAHSRIDRFGSNFHVPAAQPTSAHERRSGPSSLVRKVRRAVIKFSADNLLPDNPSYLRRRKLCAVLKSRAASEKLVRSGMAMIDEKLLEERLAALESARTLEPAACLQAREPHPIRERRRSSCASIQSNSRPTRASGRKRRSISFSMPPRSVSSR